MMVVISLAGIISWFVFLHSEYGSWSPNRIYGGWQKQTSFVQLIQEEGLERFWIMIRMMFGFWIDQRFGVIPYAPFYAAFFPALIWFVRKGNSVLKAPLLILFLFHYLALSWGAPLGGYSPPSRHFVVLLPFVLIALMTVMPQWNAWQKRCFVVLAGAGCLVSFLILTHYRTIFTDATWRNPDGYSVFWQTFHMENWIPRMTAVHLELGLIALWLSCIIALSILFYPRQQWKH